MQDQEVRDHNERAQHMRLIAQGRPTEEMDGSKRSFTKFTLVADGDEMPVVLVQETGADQATLCEVCLVWVTTYIADDDPEAGDSGVATCLPCTVTAIHFDGLRPRQ